MKEKICGVYVITHQKNGKQYIGSSVDVYRRWSVHLTYLRKGTHHSASLQQDWNDGSPEDFQVGIVERVATKELISREQFYLDTLKPAYNTSTVAGNAFRDPEIQARLPRGRDQREYTPENAAKISASLTGRKLSEEHRKKISEVQQGKELSTEHKAKISEAMKGNPKLQGQKSEEHRTSLSESVKKKWEDPEYREKMLEARRNRKKSKPRSEESRERSRIASIKAHKTKADAWDGKIQRDPETGRYIKNDLPER